MKKLFLLCFLLWNVPAWATIYYTAKDCSGGSAPPLCSDSNTGTTRQTAELTIAAGVAHLAAGDTLIIGDGTYTEALRDVIPGGTAGSPTIIKAENSHSAISTPGSHIAPAVIMRPTGGNNVIKLNHNYITIDGIDADAVNTDSAPYDTYNGGTGCTNVTIKNGRARNGNNDPTSSSGVLITGDNTLIQNMEVDGNDTGTNADHGVYISKCATGCIVEDNYIHANGAYCIQLYPSVGAVSNVIVRRNWCANNILRGVIIQADTSSFYANVMTGNARSLEVTGDGNYIIGNSLYNNMLNPAIDILAGTGNVVQNNIVYGNASDTIGDAGTGSTINHNLTTNPSWVSAATGNFTLNTGSAAIDVGVVLGPPYDTDITNASRGASYDEGAFEYGATGGTPNFKHIFQSPVIHR